MLHSNGKVAPLIEAAEGGVGGVAAGGVGPSLRGGGTLPCWAAGAPLGSDGFPLTLPQVVVWLLPL